MSKIDLAILIPTKTNRAHLLQRLQTELDKQRAGKDVILLINEDNGAENGGKTTGQKRNELMDTAANFGAKYIAFFDDDDLPGPNYITRMLEGIELGVDCCSLWGQIYWEGKPGKPFHHSIIHKEWYEDQKYYYRMPNHLNCIKLDLVKDIKFPNQNFGEDGKWSYAVRDAGVLQYEYKIEEVIYHYYVTKKK
jgi:GT2 family glycosyltransferase